MNNYLNIKTLGDLKKSGYQPKNIKQELRDNLIGHLQAGSKVFEGIHGFENTVLPDIERAILSRHNVLLLGLRGQAKTRLARLMVRLLDEYIPYIGGSELNEDPYNPITTLGRDILAAKGDDTPIEWLHRDERYIEKLATPDVSVADLIGDVDPIKAATMKLNYSDDRVIHYGIVPRSNRCIFVINELPDLQARIQVALFNILQEGDVQIRGFKLRMPLDIQFVFTANPEDYTNRGSIITPLKDRIESQILTHYPETVEIARIITSQEAKILPEQAAVIYVPELLKDLLERVVFAARESELVDEKSGVSSRMSITAYENLVSAAERRMLINKEPGTTVRITDFWGVIPSITGKIELVYEGEQEGPYDVALHLLGKAIKEEFLEHFTHPDKMKKSEKNDPYAVIRRWFSSGNTSDLINDSNDESYKEELDAIEGLKELVWKIKSLDPKDLYVYMELVLHALSEFNVLNKEMMETHIKFRDLLANMLDNLDEEEEEDEEDF